MQLVVMLLGALGAQLLAAVIPLAIQHLIDDGLSSRSRHALYKWSLILLALGILEPALLFARRFVLARAATEMEMQLRDDLYAHLQKLSLRFHGKWQSGQLLSRAIGDANIIFREFVSFAAIYLVANVVTVVFVGVLLVLVSPPLALITAIAAVPVFIAMRLFKPRFLATSRQLQDRKGDLANEVEEAALGIRVVTTFGRVKEVNGAFAKQAVGARDVAYRSNELQSRFTAALGFIPNLAMAMVVLAGSFLVKDGSLSVGGLVAFLSLMLLLTWPIESLGEIMSTTHQAVVGAERIFEVFDVEPDIEESPRARPVADIRGHIELRDVSFAYGANEPVLRNVDLVIEPGETIALVGRTGSGKSTVCSLISRLQDVTSGVITFDGHDIRDLTLASLRSHVGMAFEDPLLFSASVRENLVVGHHQASDEDIDAALRLAQATFLYDLPWGLDTRIGEQGLTLSGGQRQRLALARAVIGRPQILVLDDPLSALDVHTEALVEEALKSVLGHSTAIITAHRPSTVALADRVALLEDGRIAALGKHEELLQTNSSYAYLLNANEVKS